MAQNWNQNPASGDYVMVKGAPEQTDSLTIPAYIRLKTKRLTWLYAPDTSYGSDFHLIKKRRTDQNPTLIENVAASALQPIVDDGRAREISVTTTVATRSGVGLETKIADASGQNIERLVLPAIP